MVHFFYPFPFVSSCLQLVPCVCLHKGGGEEQVSFFCFFFLSFMQRAGKTILCCAQTPFAHVSLMLFKWKQDSCVHKSERLEWKFGVGRGK